jgi:hypothetical protein
MTADGSKVFFTSAAKLVPEDQDSSVDLYMWSEAGEKEGHPLTLISKGENEGHPGEPGNSDACNASNKWVKGCGVEPVLGGAASDSSIAAASGDVYFYSPELLDGFRGTPNQQNLYLYRDGQVHFVASFAPEAACSQETGTPECGSGALERIQVSPKGEHMAFVAKQQVTGYDNAGFAEMYTYDPAARTIHCVSCTPGGSPPGSDVLATDDGLFMSNDGRTVFYTKEALVPQDTDGIHDVYEFAQGRPQLITTGTGTHDQVFFKAGGISGSHSSGLTGISADGTNIFFSTYEKLVPQDENGDFLRFYDARAGGGFFFNQPAAPCAAADECHGAGSSAPGAPQIESQVDLGGAGNVQPTRTARHSKRRHHRRASHRGHPNHHRRGGGR